MEFIKQIICYTSLVWVIITITLSVFNKIDIKYNKTLSKYICYRCLGFWITLFMTLNPFLAAVTSLLLFLIDKYIMEKEIEL